MQKRERRPAVNGAPPGTSRCQATDQTERTALDPVDDVELLAAVHAVVDRLVRAARRAHGRIPTLGPEFVVAPWLAQVALLVVLGEGYVLRDPDQIAADQLKSAALAISTGGVDWSDVACFHAACAHTAHCRLVARRGELGPMARPFDPVAARRWARTGSSAGGAT